MLRREGLYSSHLTKWREARRDGALRGLRSKKRGAKPKAINPLAPKVRELEAKVMAAAEEEAEGADAEDAEEPAEGEGASEAMESAEEMAARAEVLAKKIAELADDFNSDLAAFLNAPANQIIEGEPLTERQAAAIGMKSSEDIELAAEYVEKGGDHRRAIDILRVALQLDPDNAAIQAALEEAQANRFLSEERFALAKKGMTQEEVRNTLGQVNLRNIRQFEERGVVAWFYATEEGGPAAAVWFQKDKKSGKLKAYQLKYDAVGGREGK